MRGNIIKALAFINSLTPTLSQGERGLLQHPPQGEGLGEGAILFRFEIRLTLFHECAHPFHPVFR